MSPLERQHTAGAARVCLERNIVQDIQPQLRDVDLLHVARLILVEDWCGVRPVAVTVNRATCTTGTEHAANDTGKDEEGKDRKDNEGNGSRSDTAAAANTADLAVRVAAVVMAEPVVGPGVFVTEALPCHLWITAMGLAAVLTFFLLLGVRSQSQEQEYRKAHQTRVHPV
eukprot:CAMPEP_0175952052 /NCGR_PEP_ID=MMETSP0108-20121206/30534_1 /TAXON_ID=195067 ORGANISM="Goniomonas pacifica, Strain CCMP1869" /NCGR_SAMPLE_ID=MMETSP0108 /ASSEMBLY_ACC=CAM_ASM_000204 /LENGTH=169 /DNA_ID=CAMNT_0017278365 /DNA_START=94 /DNA_END=601 /DNA_ORIENTATION=+